MKNKETAEQLKNRKVSEVHEVLKGLSVQMARDIIELSRVKVMEKSKVY